MEEKFSVYNTLPAYYGVDDHHRSRQGSSGSDSSNLSDPPSDTSLPDVTSERGPSKEQRPTQSTRPKLGRPKASERVLALQQIPLPETPALDPPDTTCTQLTSRHTTPSLINVPASKTPRPPAVNTSNQRKPLSDIDLAHDINPTRDNLTLRPTEAQRDFLRKRRGYQGFYFQPSFNNGAEPYGYPDKDLPSFRGGVSIDRMGWQAFRRQSVPQRVERRRVKAADEEMTEVDKAWWLSAGGRPEGVGGRRAERMRRERNVDDDDEEYRE